MKIHSRLFLFTAILALVFPALILACEGEEPADSTSAEESRPTEDAGTSDGGGGEAGRETPTEAPATTGEISATNILGGAGGMDSGRTEGEFATVSAGVAHTCGLRVYGSVACWGYNEFGQATPPGGGVRLRQRGAWSLLRFESGRLRHLLGAQWRWRGHAAGGGVRLRSARGVGTPAV